MTAWTTTSPTSRTWDSALLEHGADSLPMLVERGGRIDTVLLDPQGDGRAGHAADRDVCAAFDQIGNLVELVEASCFQSRGLVVAIHKIDVGAPIEQEAHGLPAHLPHGHNDRRLRMLVQEIGVAATVEEGPQELGIVRSGGQGQGRGPVRCPQVGIGTRRQQGLHPSDAPGLQPPKQRSHPLRPCSPPASARSSERIRREVRWTEGPDRRIADRITPGSTYGGVASAAAAAAKLEKRANH